MWDLIVSVPDHCLSFYFASTGVSKIFGNRLIFPVPTAKQQELLNKTGPYLTNAQINQMLKSNKLKLTKKTKPRWWNFAFIIRYPWIISRPSIRKLIR